MKKLIKILMCLFMCFSFTGCFSKLYTRKAENNLQVSEKCKQVSDIVTLIDNIQIMNNKVNAIKGEYTLVNTKDTYNITFEAITKSKRVNWDLSGKTKIDDKEIKIFIKDGKFYVVYPNNGANMVLKDTMQNVVTELEDTLKKLNAKYNEDNLKELVLGDKFEGINFVAMKESATYVKNSNGSYTITYLENDLVWEYEVSSDYLITNIKSSGEGFNSTLVITYPENITITYPNGLDFFTVNIKNAKQVLEIDSFAELVDPSLKEDK